ncbi:MAG: heme exporter protein CcmD [Gammaproteobacteria bacterium]
MGGYAFYVWSSYGLTALVLLANFFIPRSNEIKLIKKLSRKKERETSNT